MRSPADHYAEADRLLAEAEADMASPIFKHRLYLAEVHAMLAQCDPYELDEYAGAHYRPMRGVVTAQPKAELL